MTTAHILKMGKHKISLGDICQMCQFSSVAGIQGLNDTEIWYQYYTVVLN